MNISIVNNKRISSFQSLKVTGFKPCTQVPDLNKYILVTKTTTAGVVARTERLARMWLGQISPEWSWLQYTTITSNLKFPMSTAGETGCVRFTASSVRVLIWFVLKVDQTIGLRTPLWACKWDLETYGLLAIGWRNGRGWIYKIIILFYSETVESDKAGLADPTVSYM